PVRVMEAWDGLGYYARARNLHELSRRVTELPSDPAALRELPGIGAYTAGAVASFAYERRAALVDTNGARVVLRAFAPRLEPRSDVPAGDRAHGHRQGHRPVHQAAEGEDQRRDAVHEHASPVLEAVHAMDVREAEEPQRREHQDADAGPEVSAVHADRELIRE